MDDKNKKNPLKRMGGAKPLVLGFRFGLIRASSYRPNRKPNPTFFQKANILFKAINRKNISCKRYSLSFSGLYQSYRYKRNAVFQSSYRIFRDVSSRTVVFSVYRLALDAKPERVML